MTAPPEISQGGADAAHALALLEADCFDVPWSASALRALLDDGLTRAWLVRAADGTLVGGALVRLVAGEGELLRIAVLPATRRHGIGAALLREILSASADACPHGLYLEVRASNVAARHLYARQGFVERGRRRDYFQAPREDAILMQWRPAAALSARP